MSINKQLKIGDLTAKLPIIQGGMGVGVSRSSLAGAVAKEGGVGIISTAQIGYDEEGFEPHFSSAFFVIWLAEMVAAGKIGKNN